MGAQIIDGKAIAARITERLKSEIGLMNRKPGLTVVLVGDDPASKVYVGMKEKMSNELGIISNVIKLPRESSQEELATIVSRLNKNGAIDGILIQLPVPKQIDDKGIIGLIEPNKDVDGITPINMGRLLLGQEPWHYPCTPKGIMELIKSTGIEIKGKNAVVIGRSNIVGKPIAIMLMKEHATITICHSRTKDIRTLTKMSDIVVVAIGKEKFLTEDMVKEGSVIIDVGTNRTAAGLVGDVDFENVRNVAGFLTPVPKGVGPMTIAMLMQNCVEAAKRRQGQR